jgi:hypothetical protein
VPGSVAAPGRAKTKFPGRQKAPAPPSPSPKAARAKTAEVPASPTPAAAKPKSDARRVRLVDDAGQMVIARVYGGDDSGIVELPDGQLGWPKRMDYTDEPFHALNMAELATKLSKRDYRSFEVKRTGHYLIFYQSSRAFADASAGLLESLYKGLLTKFGEKGLNVHEAEFPLVAVIYRTEADFRAHTSVDPQIQAFYQVLSNRIFFYESSSRDVNAPDLAARRKPQTVAHEGTHQILQNIGVQPRVAAWPLWLVEGLAEYCAPTTTARNGGWAGFNKINPFNMATIRDLNDPLSFRLKTVAPALKNPDQPPQPPSFRALLTKEEFEHTDYALSWALTYYLANKKFDSFVAYLKEMAQMSPLAKPTPAQHLETFTKFFGDDLPQLDKTVSRYLASLKKYEAVAYYAVTFEQPIGPGLIQRAAIVSQSPAMIYQWLDEMTSPRGGQVTWNAYPFETRARAHLAASRWLEGQ